MCGGGDEHPEMSMIFRLRVWSNSSPIGGGDGDRGCASVNWSALSRSRVAGMLGDHVMRRAKNSGLGSAAGGAAAADADDAEAETDADAGAVCR